MTSDSKSLGIGPIDFDVELARKQGWSDSDIEAAWIVISAVGRAGYYKAHYDGPVNRCECVACDKQLHINEIPDEYADHRRRWTYVGGESVWLPRLQDRVSEMPQHPFDGGINRKL